jgi:hypothetical protein
MTMNKYVVNIDSGEPYDIYIGRGSRWGNPYSHLPNSAAPYPVDTREDAIRAYEYDLLINSDMIAEVKRELKSKRLGCHCNPLPCHGDVLARIANED